MVKLTQIDWSFFWSCFTKAAMYTNGNMAACNQSNNHRFKKGTTAAAIAGKHCDAQGKME